MGLGVKEHHLHELLEVRPAIDFVEVISENYLHTQGARHEALRAVRQRYPVHLHGLALNIASSDPLDRTYLRQLAALARELEPFLVSDHLCWTAVGGRPTYDLMPFPFTERSLRHVAARVATVQEALGRPLGLENTSTYVRFSSDTMAEFDFTAELLQRTGAQLLFDVNNLYVNAVNHHFDAHAALERVPRTQVAAYHLAGHTVREDFLFDTHDRRVQRPVWELFSRAVARVGPHPTTLEWDEHVPPLAELVHEASAIRPFLEQEVHHAQPTSPPG